MPLPIIEVAPDLGDIFLLLFNNVGVYIYYKKVVTMTPLATLALEISLVLVFLASPALVNRRLFVLTIRYINGKNVSRFNSFEILLFLLLRSFLLGIP